MDRGLSSEEEQSHTVRDGTQASEEKISKLARTSSMTQSALIWTTRLLLFFMVHSDQQQQSKWANRDVV